LTALLEASLQAGKRQAAPFRKADGPKPDPKRPGRKSGDAHGCHAHRAAPEPIDERYDVPLPEECPHCDGQPARGSRPRLVRGAQQTTRPVVWQVRETVSNAVWHSHCARLPRQVLDLVAQAYDVRRRWRAGLLDDDQQTESGLTLACRLEDAARGRYTCAANRRLADHVLAHAMHWFWFLIDPAIDATNWRAEQAIRPAVVNRKVWGGNRTRPGAQVQAILTSLAVTLTQRHHDPLSWFTA